jgi:hypothetical protein
LFKAKTKKMAQKSKICVSCSTAFIGRRDAKTCSDRCRKKLQRVKANLAKELASIERSAKRTLHELEADLSLAQQSQQGFIGETDPTQATPAALPVQEPTVAFSTTSPNQESTTYSQPPPFDPKTLAPINPMGEGGKEDQKEVQEEKTLPQNNLPPIAPPIFNTYQAPKPTLRSISKPNEEALDSGTLLNPKSSVTSSSIELSSRGLALRVLVVLGLILISGIIAIFFSYRSNQGKDLANDGININQTQSIGGNNEIEIQLKQALLKVNRNLKIADGKFLTATGQVLIQNETNSVNADALPI